MHPGTYTHSQGGKLDQISNFPEVIEVKRSQQETFSVMQNEVEVSRQTEEPQELRVQYQRISAQWLGTRGLSL